MPDHRHDPAPLIAREFGRGGIASVRHAVSSEAEGAGLTGQRLDDFVLAVNEIITNAVRHSDGRGRLRLWLAGGSVFCEVSDSGPGIPADRIDPPRPPVTFVPGGRGIWMARQLCDQMTMRTGPDGTTIRMAVTLPGAATGAGADQPPRAAQA